MATHAHSTTAPARPPASPLAGLDRRKIERAVERLIAVLDAIDGDPDLEVDGLEELSLQAEIRGGANVRAA